MNFIGRCDEDYIVTSDCDMICNIDIADVITFHEENAADITIVTKKVDPSLYPLSANNQVVNADENGRLIDVADYTAGTSGDTEVSLNVMVFGRTFLTNMLLDASAHGYTAFYRDIVARNAKHSKIMVYRYDGYYSLVGSLSSYFESSMKLLDSEAREGLFGIRNRPILTKVRNSPPTKYTKEAKVSNSLIADGCIIEGEIENSILFRGVRIGKGAVIKNSILMQDTFVGSDTALNCVITDKNVVIKDGRILSGHETMPFFVGKGIMV